MTRFPRSGSRRRFLAGAAGLAALSGCLGSGGGSGTGTGDVPRYESLDVAGSPGGSVPLRATGRVTLLDFFATWCAPCRPQMETLRRVRERFATDRLYALSLTPESDEGAVRDFWTEFEGTWPVAMDSESDAIQEYGVKGIPTLLVLDPDGEVQWRHRGLAGYDTVESKVEAAMGG